MNSIKEPQADTTLATSSEETLHNARRGDILAEDAFDDRAIDGYDADRMRARSSLTAEEEKKLLRRMDLRIMPLCALMFLLKNMDYQNVSNARIMNKGTPHNILNQLDMTSNEYNFITTIYYIPYIVFETPSNLLFKRLLPSRWQSRIVVTWGICTACLAAVSYKQGLYAGRFFLGLAEAGMFPGVILHLTYWYRPDEMSLRLLYFYICSNFSGVICGIMAYGFNGASGSHGLAGWQWLFLTQGLLTIVLGVIVYFFLPDFPQHVKWLTPRERAFIEARLPENAPRAQEANFNFQEVVTTVKDVRLWLFTLIWAFMTIGTTGLTFYQPTVIANLGFTTIAQAQLLNLPTSIVAALAIATFGIWADTARLPRPLYPLTFLVIILACYSVLYTFPSNGGVYAATVIANGASAAWYPLMWPWRVQTTKRATGSAFAIGFVNSYGQIGGALGPQIFRSQYAPFYTVSFLVAMVMIGCSILTTLGTWWITRDTERRTRELKRARLVARQRGEVVLEDVVDRDLEDLATKRKKERV